MEKTLQGIVYLSAGTYNLTLPNKPFGVTQLNGLSNIVLQDVYILCDTSTGAIDISLPSISSFNYSWNANIYISDISNTASSGNITISASGTDKIDGSGTSSLSISSDGGALSLQIANASLWISSAGGSGAGLVEYKQSRLPDVSINPQSVPDGDIIGDAITTGFGISRPFIRLNNNKIASVDYCQSMLKSGILIYECYTFQEEINENTGWWVAFKPNASNPKLLEKVAELKMTTQFWDNWYDYTVKRFGDNTVEFVSVNYPSDGTQNVQSWITKLEFNPTTSTLTATDTTNNLNKTYIQLYEQLWGNTLPGGPEINYANPWYILDDDYYGMCIGTDSGWLYYNVKNFLGIEKWNMAGFNILTGQTRWLTAGVNSQSITNFDFSAYIPGSGDWIKDFRSQANGIIFGLADGMLQDNGDNYNNVTAIYSPYATNPNIVTYLTVRDQLGAYFMVGGLFKGVFSDHKNLYVNYNLFSDTYLQVAKYDLSFKTETIITIPFMNGTFDVINFYENNQGVLFIARVFSSYYSTNKAYYYIKQDEGYYQLQSNNFYPTNLLKDKSFSNIPPEDIVPIYNIFTEVDQWKGVDFDNN